MARGTALRTVRLVLLVVASAAACVIPLPGWLEPARPAFLSITLLWLVFAGPRPAGLLAAWLAGLLLDLLQGGMLGQNALAMVVTVAIALKFRLQVRAFPPLNQAVVVAGLLFIYEFLMFWTDGMAGLPGRGGWRWLYPVTSALLWPLLAATHQRVLGRH